MHHARHSAGTGHIGRMLNGLRAWRERRRMQNALHAMPRDAGDRMLHDLGLDRDWVGSMGQAEAVRELLPAMMKRFGLDAENVNLRHRLVLRDMQRVCSGCPATGRCARALRADATASTCGEFCANAPTLLALARQSAIYY